jgi:hypothetical protein
VRVRNLLVAALWLAPAALASQGAPADTTAPARVDTAPLSLVREVFSFQGGGRDPFISLLKTGDVRPMITDLKLVTVVYDDRYSARSVAILRDVTTGKRYRAKTGDVIGRLRVTQIRPREVVFTVQEFGFERQQTLSIVRPEETP